MGWRGRVPELCAYPCSWLVHRPEPRVMEESFLSFRSINVREAFGMGCSEGVTPASDIASFLGMSQVCGGECCGLVCWRAGAELVARGHTGIHAFLDRVNKAPLLTSCF